jgi:hypothetical protein
VNIEIYVDVDVDTDVVTDTDVETVMDVDMVVDTGMDMGMGMGLDMDMDIFSLCTLITSNRLTNPERARSRVLPAIYPLSISRAFPFVVAVFLIFLFVLFLGSIHYFHSPPY